mmetsp:Transcript_3544/g.8549  ORF Transcript_3544/g.8549 Transcript_3544/m.8549 type:complete len:210 (+) Transcript_3544:53-682(+)
MLFRSVLLLAVAAVAVDAAATCESITIKGSGLCTNDITEMVCVPDGQTAAAYKTVMETGAALMDQSFCELAQSGCVGTLSKNADYCKTNGGMCTYMHVGMKVNNICSTATTSAPPPPTAARLAASRPPRRSAAPPPGTATRPSARATMPPASTRWSTLRRPLAPATTPLAASPAPPRSLSRLPSPPSWRPSRCSSPASKLTRAVSVLAR